MNKKGYVSPIFLLIAGVFLTVLMATLIVNAKLIDFAPQASEIIKSVNLLPGEQSNIICGNGSTIEVVSQTQSSYLVTCTGVLPSN